MMNRTQAPELNLIDRLDINNFKKTSLSNGVEVYYVNSAEEDLIRIELRFVPDDGMNRNTLSVGRYVT